MALAATALQDVEPLSLAGRRPGTIVVPRERLVRRLLRARSVPVVVIAAPAGYGKTTLVTQWTERERRPVAWLTLDDGHNDPRELLSAIGLALGDTPDTTSVPRLMASLRGREHPAVLVLDDAHVLNSADARRVVAVIAEAAGTGVQLVLVSRTGAVLGVGRLRLQGALLELGARDLTMTATEAALLLRLRGLELPPERAAALLRRTEGWPAALSLAALAGPAQSDGADLSGEDRFVAEYVAEELLADLAPGDLEFVTRTSVLDEITAARCDAILGRRDAAGVLARLAGSNLPLVALDRRGQAYRYHRLFAEVLRAELRRREPGLEVELHARASVWCEHHGDAEGAIEHAIAAQDASRASRLLWNDVLEHAAATRGPTVGRRLRRFGEDEVRRTPLLALAGAGAALVEGNLFEAERLTLLAADNAGAGETVRGGVALMEAAFGRRGMAVMRERAAAAHDLLGSGDPWRPLCRYLEGVALHLTGGGDAAVEPLQEAAHRATASAPMVQVLALAQLALMAAQEHHVERAGAVIARVVGQVRRTGLDLCPPVALALAVAAEVRAERGDVAQATAERRQALGLLRRIVDPSPWYDAACRIVLARTTLRLGHPAAAAELLTDAERALTRVPDAPVLREWHDRATAEVDRALRSAAGAEWALTAAEVRVLHHLPSHLTFPEIAERLCVSPNTVKTHARGIYRKLGVSSRGAAVELARGAGLLDHLEVA